MLELDRAARTMANNKSTGIDNIPNELLTLPALRDLVLKALNDMLEHGISADLKTSAIVPLPKKGDLSDTNNWRGICLMPHITKLFDKLLLHRIRDAIDESLECTQNGFRPGRGTAQHAAAFRLLVERAQATKAPMHGCFPSFS
eukprot:PhM_4_TR8398/c3_g1_i3/m.62670